jgi:pimeloyl-ACP methyl ester carboxylesterase
VESSELRLPTPAMDTLDVAGTRVWYGRSGTGHPIVLLHGWGASSATMALVHDDLARQYDVTAIDLPGHGRSELPPQAWGTADYTACLLDVMRRLGIEHPHLIGHSFGGRIALDLAARYPERVAKLVLVSSAGLVPQRSVGYYLRTAVARTGRVFGRFGSRGRALKTRLYSKVASPDYAQAGPMRPTFVKVVTEDLAPLLPAIQAPTLLIWGDRDTETPPAVGRRMARLIPTASMTLIEGAGHYPFLDQFGKFRLIVRRFLRDDPGMDDLP